MRCLLSLTFAVIVLISGVESAKAHHQGFEICNKGEEEIMILFVHKTGMGVFSGQWTAIGRYYYKPGECWLTPMGEGAGDAYMTVIVDPRSSNSYVGNYGSGRINDFITNVDEAFCVKLDGPFERSGSLDQMRNCPSGFVLIEFTMHVNLWDNQVKKTLPLS